jgi:hypothetical protein
MRHESITEGGNSFNEPRRARVIAKLLADQSYGAGERGLLDEGVLPDGFENGTLLDESAPAAYQQKQHTERFRLERHSAPMAGQAEVLIVEFIFLKEIDHSALRPNSDGGKPNRNLIQKRRLPVHERTE